MSRKLRRLDEVEINSTGQFVQFTEIDVNTSDGVLHCSGKEISFKTYEDDMYLLLRDVVAAFQLKSQLKRFGWSFMDKALMESQLPVDSCFLFNKKTRIYIKEKGCDCFDKSQCLQRVRQLWSGISSNTLQRGYSFCLYKKADLYPEKKGVSETCDG